jgi:hypothetical protein
MIEVLKQQSNGEEFLSVMPPVSQANVWSHLPLTGGVLETVVWCYHCGKTPPRGGSAVRCAALFCNCAL